MSQLPFEFCHIDISCSGIKHQNSDSADAGESWQLLFRPDNQSDHISVFFCADFHFVHAGHCHHLEPEPGCHHHSKHHHFRFPGKFRNNTAWFHRYLCRTLSATTMQVSEPVVVEHVLMNVNMIYRSTVQPPCCPLAHLWLEFLQRLLGKSQQQIFCKHLLTPTSSPTCWRLHQLSSKQLFKRYTLSSIVQP